MSTATNRVSALLFPDIPQETLGTSLYMELSFYFDKATAVMSEFRKRNPPGNDVDYEASGSLFLLNALNLIHIITEVGRIWKDDLFFSFPKGMMR